MTDSRYVVPTGRGYLGTHTVSTGGSVTLSSAVLADREWCDASRVHALAREDGIALVPATTTAHAHADSITEYALCSRRDALRIGVGPVAITELGLEPTDSVRVYDLAAIDDRPGLLLVDAADDPRLETDRDAPDGSGSDALEGSEP
ncbi:hypothetical protein [Natronorubrum daqingense]|uniref:Uncharacterized protein n=1 Tax=Natronorubrum daqingense TaxID=588898 RepID=A0A1N7FFR4_9EURY|nr:hypothetical protein [Natronorubrum daqingense]APX98398.1 hypothetical protein BB347_16960 [Natronorubrum daqingense]SIR99075.1 hypothetical protein SAMN05421809_3176 [Natronorubrum daqingense]